MSKKKNLGKKRLTGKTAVNNVQPPTPSPAIVPASECSAMNPWCECCYCERKTDHRGKHRVTYSSDRVARWNDNDFARLVDKANDSFKKSVCPLAVRYKTLMRAGADVRKGDRHICSRVDEHRLHGGLMMLAGVIVDTTVQFRRSSVRMSDGELREFLTSVLDVYADDLFEWSQQEVFGPGVTTKTLGRWYGIADEQYPHPEKMRVKVGRRKLKFS